MVDDPTEDMGRKMSRVFKTIDEHSTMLVRLDEKMTVSGKKTDKISDTLDHLVRVDERFIQFLDTDRESKERMWKHIEKSEGRLNAIHEAEIRTASVNKVITTLLLAGVAAVVTFMLRG